MVLNPGKVTLFPALPFQADPVRRLICLFYIPIMSSYPLSRTGRGIIFENGMGDFEVMR
jgi:hypothetical protein